MSDVETLIKQIDRRIADGRLDLEINKIKDALRNDANVSPQIRRNVIDRYRQLIKAKEEEWCKQGLSPKEHWNKSRILLEPESHPNLFPDFTSTLSNNERDWDRWRYRFFLLVDAFEDGREMEVENNGPWEELTLLNYLRWLSPGGNAKPRGRKQQKELIKGFREWGKGKLTNRPKGRKNETLHALPSLKEYIQSAPFRRSIRVKKNCLNGSDSNRK